MTGAVIDLTAGVLAVAAFLAAYLMVRRATRPVAIEPGPSTMDLGDEPPAVVSLLVNGWEPTDDAPAATLLDLAARGYSSCASRATTRGRPPCT